MRRRPLPFFCQLCRTLVLVVPDHRGGDEDPDAVDDGREAGRAAEGGDERGGGLPARVERGELREGGVEGLRRDCVVVAVFLKRSKTREPGAWGVRRERAAGRGQREGTRKKRLNPSRFSLATTTTSTTAVFFCRSKSIGVDISLLFPLSPGSAASSDSKCTPRPQPRAGPSRRAGAR